VAKRTVPTSRVLYFVNAMFSEFSFSMISSLCYIIPSMLSNQMWLAGEQKMVLSPDNNPLSFPFNNCRNFALA